MQTILFADDDRRVLSGLRRQLHQHRSEWEMVFAPGGPEAIDALKAQTFDAVVTDMRMPVVDGAQVLAQVAHAQPRTARLVLSGHADHDRSRLAASCAHRYLNKPCPPEVLELEIRQALTMRQALEDLDDPKLTAIWREPPGLVAECGHMLAALHTKPVTIPDDVFTFLHDNEVLWSRIREASSAAYPQEVSLQATPEQVATSLGARTLLASIMAVRFLQTFDPPEEKAWGRAVNIAVKSLGVAREQELPDEAVIDAFVAGILSQFVSQRKHPEGLDVLAYLLPTWGFGDAVVDALTGWPQRLQGTAEPGAPAALLAALLILGEVDADRAAEHLEQAGWGVRVPKWRAMATSSAAGQPRQRS